MVSSDGPDTENGSGAIVDIAGRLEWFEHTVLPNEAALRARLRRTLRAPLDVDDLVSEVLLRAFNSSNGPTVQSELGWLLQIARNILIDMSRRDKIVRFDLVADIDLLDDNRAAERGLVARDELRRIQIALDGLPPQQRRAFLLRRLDGRSMIEVAEIMHLSVSTVEKHVARAVRGIMDMLGEGGVTGDNNQRSGGDQRARCVDGRPFWRRRKSRTSD